MTSPDFHPPPPDPRVFSGDRTPAKEELSNLVRPIALEIARRQFEATNPEDIAQDVTLLLVNDAIARGMDVSNPAKLRKLVRIRVRTTVLKTRRSLERQRHHEPIESAILRDPGAFFVDPDNSVESALRLAAVKRALPILAPKPRAWVAMRLDGYEYEEIAKESGVSVQRVKNSITESVKILYAAFVASGEVTAE